MLLTRSRKTKVNTLPVNSRITSGFFYALKHTLSGLGASNKRFRPSNSLLQPRSPFIKGITLRIALIALFCLILSFQPAFASEWSDYKEFVFINYHTLIEKYNSGESYGAWIVPEEYEVMIMQECFGYTTKEELEAKWKDKRAPVGIYAFYLENKEKLWDPIDNKIITVE